MTLRILPSATLDIRSGFRFYEEQQSGLGAYFLHSVFQALDSMHGSAGVHPRFEGYQRKLIPKFPFAIYYRIDGAELLIFAVLDCRRSPDLIRKRLQSL